MTTQSPLEKAQAKVAMISAQIVSNDARYAEQMLAIPFQYNARKDQLEAFLASAQSDLAALQT